MKNNTLTALCVEAVGTRVLVHRIFRDWRPGSKCEYSKVAAPVGASLVMPLSYDSSIWLPTASICFCLPEKFSDLQRPPCMQVEQARSPGE